MVWSIIVCIGWVLWEVSAVHQEKVKKDPLKAINLDCETARFIGAANTGLSDGLCRMLCLKDCGSFGSQVSAILTR